RVLQGDGEVHLHRSAGARRAGRLRDAQGRRDRQRCGRPGADEALRHRRAAGDPVLHRWQRTPRAAALRLRGRRRVQRPRQPRAGRHAVNGSTKVVLVALAAGTLGGVAALAVRGPGPLLGTEIGQRAVQGALTATAPAAPEGVPVPKRGEAAAPVTPGSLAGPPATVPGLAAGRPTLVNLWASWCGPCIEEMPELQRFHAAQGANGVQVVGIALDDRAAVEDFLRRIPVDYPILLDAPGP